MSRNLTRIMERKAKRKRDNDGDIAVASIWLGLYLFMVLAVFFGPVVTLVLFAAVLGGWGVLAWHGNKKGNRIMKSRKLFASASPKNVMQGALFVLATSVFVLASASARASDVSVTFDWTSFTSKLDLSIPPGVPPTILPIVDINGQRPTYTPDVNFTVNGLSGQTVDFHETNSSNVDQIHNVVQFTPGPAVNVSRQQEFLVGTFHLVDGTWFGGADISFTMTTHSSDPTMNGLVYSDTLRMVFNPFDPDPNRSADFFYLVNQRTAFHNVGCAAASANAVCGTSLRVYELFGSPILPNVDGVSNAGDVDLIGEIDGLDPIEFRNPTGGLFLSSSFDTDPNGGATPLPAALPLFTTGLGALGLLGWRRKRKAVGP